MTVETPLTLAFSTAASITVSCPTTMILCGWIVLILQVQSVFNCPSEPSDPCCPDEDKCCNDVGKYGWNHWRGVCCKDKISFSADLGISPNHCLCTTNVDDWYGVMLPFVKANWGYWGYWQYCPEGEYVVGMQVKYERWQEIEQSTNLREDFIKRAQSINKQLASI